MTDYFALLGQPRRPWLDPEKLKKIFHEKSLKAHPDAQNQAGDNEAFTQLNEAYQILREPKHRLQHLLALEGGSIGTKTLSIPANIESLFPEVAAVTQEADRFLQTMTRATSLLSRSLVRPELLGTAERIKQMLQTLTEQRAAAVAELRQLSETWTSGKTNQLPELQALYLQFSYLTKWTAELEERELQITSAL